MKAILLTKNSNVEDNRNIAAIFSERRAIQATHGEPLPEPIMIQNLDVEKPSTKIC